MQQKKLLPILLLSVFLCFSAALSVSAHQPRIVKQFQLEAVVVENPELSQAFYDELTGEPRVYTVMSSQDFDLYLNLLVPKSSNAGGRYSAEVYKINGNDKELINFLSATSSDWAEFYEEFAADTYLKGPEFEEQVTSGTYEIVVFNENDQGKYVLAVGKQEKFGPRSIFEAFYILPILKVKFFQTSVLRLLFPAKLGIMYWIVLAVLVLIIVAIVCKIIRKRRLRIKQ